MKTATELYAQAQDELARFGPNACLTLKAADVLFYLGGEDRAALRTYQVEITFGDASGSLSFPVQATHIADACTQAWRDIETRGIKAGAVHVFDAASELAQARAEIAGLRTEDARLRNEVTTERLAMFGAVARLEREIERLEGLLNPKPESDAAVQAAAFERIFGPIEPMTLDGPLEGLDLDVGPGMVEHATLSGDPCTCPHCVGLRTIEANA